MDESARIRLVLKNGFRYEGEILELSDTHIIITDRYGDRVKIARDSIAVEQEVNP